jgi:hypothetical protein
MLLPMVFCVRGMLEGVGKGSEVGHVTLDVRTD